MQDDKNKIEAVLFTTGRFLDIEEMAKMCGIGSIGYAKEALLSLKRDYEDKNSALQIIEQGSKFKLNIRKEYLYLTESLLTDSELDRPTQETLAVIAYKNPALQSEIIKIRGNGAYDHIKVLKELDFVVSEPTGRTKILKLTNKFYDYFDVVEDQLRSKLQDAPKNSLPENEINNETKVVTQDETSN
ncbi:SMC-Scp complex subunit ScpB [Candidatus Woesearchaeota archaeon]|nr:SMC-Scp complex subunit ScpB [Candidatus Woesearchaeota archaeon]